MEKPCCESHDNTTDKEKRRARNIFFSGRSKAPETGDCVFTSCMWHKINDSWRVIGLMCSDQTITLIQLHLNGLIGGRYTWKTRETEEQHCHLSWHTTHNIFNLLHVQGVLHNYQPPKSPAANYSLCSPDNQSHKRLLCDCEIVSSNITAAPGCSGK